MLLMCLGNLTMGAQSIAELKKQLEQGGDSDKMLVALQLADLYLEKDGGQAVDYAEQALELAIHLRAKRQQAQALNIRAKGTWGQDGDKNVPNVRTSKRDRRDAVRDFEESRDLARSVQDIPLLRDNLMNLVELSMDSRDYRDAKDYVKSLLDLNANNNRYDARRELAQAREILAREEQTLSRERNELREEKSRLLKEIIALRNDKNALSRDRTQLAAENKEIKVKVKEQEAAITDMTEAQAKEALARERDRRLLDSLNSRAMIDSLAKAQLLMEKEQSEMALTNSELENERGRYLRNILIVLSLLVLAVAAAFYIRYRAKAKSNNLLAEKNKTIAEEQERSEGLLLNILPASIATELKQYGAASAVRHEQATVLFTDFANFTAISERLTPEELVRELDYCFKGFDFIISQHDIEKIKTIGDAYMCANGLTGTERDYYAPVNMVNAALEIQQFLADYKADRIREGRPYFEARIGIHTGPVVAGVVGTKKFAYDIWGDTVNLASRMESNSAPGRVNISESTRHLVEPYFRLEYRGKIAAKNKGDVDMYYVSSAKDKAMAAVAASA